MTVATFCAMPLNFSFISPEKSLRASSTLRCSVFSFSSMVRRRVWRSVSLSLSPAVCRSFFNVSTSSLSVLICCCLGWYLVFSSAKARWPSLVWPTTASNWMTAILVGPAETAESGAPGAEGGSAAVCEGAEAWASALTPSVDASMQTSDKERFIWLGNSLTVLVGIDPGTCGRAVPYSLLAQFGCGYEDRNLHTRDTDRGHLRNLRTIIEHVSGCEVLRCGPEV